MKFILNQEDLNETESEVDQSGSLVKSFDSKGHHKTFNGQTIDPHGSKRPVILYQNQMPDQPLKSYQVNTISSQIETSPKHKPSVDLSDEICYIDLQKKIISAEGLKNGPIGRQPRSFKMKHPVTIQ